MYIIKIPTTKGKHLLVTSQARSRGKKEIEAREKNAEPDKNKAEVNPPPPKYTTALCTHGNLDQRDPMFDSDRALEF